MVCLLVQAEWLVVLSKRMILKDIADRLGLQMHAMGVFVHESGLQVAWIDMDVPPSDVGDVKGREKFHSVESVLRVDAIEDVSARAVEWLVEHCCVKVVDLSYDKMKELEGKIGGMETLVSVYCEKADECKKEEATKRRYGDLFADGQSILKKFADVVPTDHAPSSRLEELVCELSVLIANGKAMSAPAADMVCFCFRGFK